jgi:DNA invertase Pin-like site-specific DNA recombinase
MYLFNCKKNKKNSNLKRQKDSDEYDKNNSKKIRKDNNNIIINNLDNLLNKMDTKDTSMNAIIYIRCSSKKQNEGDLHGAETQKADCIDYAKKNNFNIISILEDTFNGHDITKLKIYDIIKSNNYNLNIIVADPSRLSRRPAHGISFIEECMNRKIIIHSARNNISTETTMGQYQFGTGFYEARIESEQQSKRSRALYEQKKKNGSHIGIAPFGYHLKKIISPNSQYPITVKEENEYEQKVIKLISMLYYGNEREEIYKIMREISQNLLARIYYYDENTKKDVEHELRIYYGNMTRQDIADILNKNNILKRGKQWSKNMVSRIIIDLNNNENIQYLCEDGKYYDIEREYENKMEDEEKGEEEVEVEEDPDDDCNEKIIRMKIEMKKMQEELNKLKNNKCIFPEVRKRNPNYNYYNDSFENEL